MKKRIKFFIHVTVVFFSIIILRLFSLQIIKHSHYLELAKQNGYLNIKTAALRSNIEDRNGVILAKSERIFTISFGGTKKELAHIKNIMIQNGFEKSITEGLILKYTKLKWEQISKIFQIPSLPMPEISMDQTRVYPYKEACAQLTGYVQSNEEAHYIGKSGIEKAYDDQLKGKCGKDVFTINARRIRLQKNIRESQKPEQAKPLKLAIDAEIQEFAYQLLTTRIQAAIMVIDVLTGEIVVYATYPAFDPNHFSEQNNEKLKEYYTSSTKPLLNTLLNASFPPGSTMKSFMLMAMLIKKNIAQEFFCNGGYRLGNKIFRCLHIHGNIKTTEILPKSCNCAFYSFSEKLSKEDLQNTWKLFGLGEPILENFTSKQPKFPQKEKWKRTDTLFMNIGQGASLVTIAQLTRAYARLVTGKKIDVSFLKQEKAIDFETLPIEQHDIDFIKKALFDTINSPIGTAYNVYKFINAGGKTGTAQVRAIKKSEYGKGNAFKPWEHRDHALFCAFVPYEKPRYVGCAIIIHGGSGHNSAYLLLPVLEKLMQKEEQKKLTSKQPQTSISN